ncbi:MAG: MnhB domain-containing protein [Planctomycetota bacterium]
MRADRDAPFGGNTGPILRTTVRWLVPLLVLAALFLLVRGHNEPGGGFAGGLLAALAVIITAMAQDGTAARRLLRVSPTVHIGAGLLIALISGLLRIGSGDAFLHSVWVAIPLGFTKLKLGTPLIFDIGVFLVVLGAVSAFALEIAEARQEKKAMDARDAGEGASWKS